jgi:TM2 domain-containing membrane protein YozV
MRKLLSPFLTGIFFLFSFGIGKGMDIPLNPIKCSVVFSGLNKPVIQTLSLFSDSLKTNDVIPRKKHRLVAALLSFPFPCGIFGLHRVYLGTSGKVPFFYIITLGGGAGTLPFIDFVMILLSRNKEFHAIYEGNHHLFMWHKNRDILMAK